MYVKISVPIFGNFGTEWYRPHPYGLQPTSVFNHFDGLKRIKNLMPLFKKKKHYLRKTLLYSGLGRQNKLKGLLLAKLI
ncbi:hypothetical protein HanIR_Chr10g0465761 [Helianthus annuus]|nr:hypothetical protein HanIR_Chr10g0465761 [Helianthus annuus]